MAKKKSHNSDLPDGDLIAANLARLGYENRSVQLAEIARIISKNTGKTMSRQRISNILGSLRVSMKSVHMLANGLRVKPADLMMPVKKKSP